MDSGALKGRMNRRGVLRSGAGLAAGAGAFVVAGCGDDTGEAPAPTPAPETSTPEPQRKQGGVLRTLAGPIGPLPDPHQTRTASESLMWQWAGNLLVRFSRDSPYVIEGDLAQALPEISPEGMTLTFKIRPEAKWQNRAPVNGRAVTSEDVKASFERIKALGVKSPRAGNYTNVDSITTPDPQTVQFKLKSPQADLLSAMADQFDVVLPKELSVRGDAAIKEIGDVIGSGPYELQAYEPGRKVTMVRRPDGYWRSESAWVDEWHLLDLRDEGQKSNVLLAGQAEFAELPPVLARIFDSRTDFEVMRTPSPARECVLINHTAAKWKDPRVRLAASRAIDRRGVYAAMVESEGVAGGPMGAAAKQWALSESELEALPGYGKDRGAELTEATKLMKAAGFPDGFDDTLLTVSSLKMDLAAQAVVANLADIGIRIKTQVLGDDVNVLTERARKGDFSLIATLFLAGIYPDAQLYLYHRTGGSANYGKFSSSALDAKLDKQRGLYDTAQRTALVQEIQRDIINGPGPLWLGSRLVLGVASKRVHDMVATPFLSGYGDAEHVWVSK
jgi:peptide/nickel transport system substrate-binding protein